MHGSLVHDSCQVGVKEAYSLLSVGFFHCAGKRFGGWISEEYHGIFNGCMEEVDVVEAWEILSWEPH